MTRTYRYLLVLGVISAILTGALSNGAAALVTGSTLPGTGSANGPVYDFAGQLIVDDAVAPVTATVDYGDGTPVAALPLVHDVADLLRWSFTLHHVYAATNATGYSVTIAATQGGVTANFTTTVPVFSLRCSPACPTPTPTPTPIGSGPPTPTPVPTPTPTPDYIRPQIDFTYQPTDRAVWGQDVAFTAHVTGYPDWNWVWQFEPGVAPVPAGQLTSLDKTMTHSFAAPGSYIVTFRSLSLVPPNSGGKPTKSRTVNVYGRNQVVSVDCGNPVYGLPTTFTATLTDLSPQPSATTLLGKLISFAVNGTVLDSRPTTVLTSPTTAVATYQTTLDLALTPGGSYTCGAFIAGNTSVPLTVLGALNGPVIGVVFPVMPPGSTLFPVGTTFDPTNGTFITPTNVIQPYGTDPRGAPRAFTVRSSIGKVEGEARAADGSRAEFEIRSKDGLKVTGELRYRSPTLSFKAKSFSGLGITPDAKRAIAVGTGRTDGPGGVAVPFVVRFTAGHDEHAPPATFSISLDGGLTWSDPAARGEVEIRLGCEDDCRGDAGDTRSQSR